MSRDRITEDAARGVASKIIDIASPANGVASRPEDSRAATAAQSRDYAEMTQVAARLPRRGLGWMAFCLES